MRMELELCVIAVLSAGLASAAETDPHELTLPATKDVRITCHRDEAEFNGGASPRLRTSNIKANAGEIVIMDFDRATLAAFLEKNKGKAITAKLVLISRGLHHGKTATVEAAALDTASEWTEGDKIQTKAAKGEAAFVAAQFETRAWTTADGKEVANLRDVFYDAATDAIKTSFNSKTLTINASEEDKPVAMELDAKFVEHLATSEQCKGLLVFNRDRNMLADFYSREQDGKGPKLVLTVSAETAAKEPATK